MRFLSNAHTHSTFCDGKNPPEEMIRAAELLRRTGYRTVLRLGTGGELWQEENL